MVEANPEVFPNDAHLAGEGAWQNCEEVVVGGDGGGRVSAPLQEEGVVVMDGQETLTDPMDLSELGGVDAGVSNSAVLATLRSLVEVMNSTGLGGGEGGAEDMEVWSHNQRGRAGLWNAIVINFTL